MTSSAGNRDRSARVAVFFLGGTIGMTAEPGQGAAPALDGADLLAGLPPLGLEVDPVDFRKVNSARLRADDLLELHAAAGRAVDRGAVGVVVVQGTDVLEESAYLLDLLWSRAEPLVVTGAMRHPALPGPDGPANLTAALHVAAAPQCRDLGVLVVLADEIHAARHVQKRHASLPAAFTSPGLGPLGHLLEGVPAMSHRVARRGTLTPPLHVDARVPVMTATFDDDPAVYRVVADISGGVVVAGLGAGHVAPEVADAVVAVNERLPVVLATRTGGGSVHRNTYRGVGSERDLLARGLVHAGMLDPLKARVLLRLLLSATTARDAIAAAFAEHGAP